MKAAVVKADRYEPEFQRTFNECVKHRAFVIDAAVVRHATGKPKVKRQVPYARVSFVRGEQWLDRDHGQREAIQWCLSTAGTRIHATTRLRPLEQFESQERAEPKPLEGEHFDVPIWGKPKIHPPDHHVRFGKALYSVPHTHNARSTKGLQVTIRGDSRLVRTYLKGVFKDARS